MFQSSPAIAGGRDSVPHPHPPTASGFNPRPPLLAGATIQRHCYWRGFLMFQSSPAIAGGRDISSSHPRGNHVCFNPRPPLLAGATPHAEPLCTSIDRFQSSPAIAGGRDSSLISTSYLTIFRVGCAIHGANWLRQRKIITEAFRISLFFIGLPFARNFRR